MVASSAKAQSDPPSAPDTQTQKITLELHGLSQTLKNLVLSNIDEHPQITTDEVPGYSEKLKQSTLTSLQSAGYYQSKVTVKHASYKSHSSIAIYVDPGTPVRIRTIEINVTEPDEFKKTTDELPLTKGARFDHRKYENSKAALLKTAQVLGYFDAKFTRSQVLVSKRDKSADIYVDFDTGKRYDINKVVYKQDLYPEGFLARWQNFEVTVPYRANYISDLTVNLQNSGYFKRVRVTPDIKMAINHKVPLVVELEPHAENTVGFGAGFATDTGPRLKTNWLRPHTNSAGHSLETNASVSKLRQDLSASYRIPHHRFPAHNHYSADFGVLNHRTDDTFSQLRTLEFTEHRLTKRKWYRDVFLRLENERFNVAGDKDKVNLLLPGFGFSRVNSVGGINPQKGRFFSFRLMAARRTLLSDINMLRATAKAKFLNSWDRKHYLISRVELGALNTDSFENVPATHRFFAGGDNSVRGFGYQAISPVNSNNESIGGQYLTTGSIEYNHYFTEKFAVAAFLDAGRAFNNSSDPTRHGIGLGLRWRSPVGPLRLDLAHAINNEDSPYRLHLAIGPEL